MTVTVYWATWRETNYTQTTSRNGLGLFICHSIVQSLHGTIEVKSEEGRFAEFIVRLPHLEAEEEEAEPENEEPETVPVLSSPIDETGLRELFLRRINPVSWWWTIIRILSG